MQSQSRSVGAWQRVEREGLAARHGAIARWRAAVGMNKGESEAERLPERLGEAVAGGVADRVTRRLWKVLLSALCEACWVWEKVVVGE